MRHGHPLSPLIISNLAVVELSKTIRQYNKIKRKQIGKIWISTIFKWYNFMRGPMHARMR